MARKIGQIIARGDRRWLIRVYLGPDHETKKRNYHNRTVTGKCLRLNRGCAESSVTRIAVVQCRGL